jgi:hypothetical protein
MRERVVCMRGRVVCMRERVVCMREKFYLSFVFSPPTFNCPLKRDLQ